MSSSTHGHKRLAVRELVVFALLGVLMAISDLLMEGLPNIHAVGLFIAAITVVFRAKALFPIYTYVFLIGAVSGFGLWWLAYLYAWAILWALIMLIPKRLPRPLFFAIVHTVTTLHGLAFGVLTAPVVALMWKITDWEFLLSTVAAGFYFDLLHAVGNFAFGFFIAPLSALLTTLSRRR